MYKKIQCGAEPTANAMDLPLRSTVCDICGVDTNSYNLNYGANSCLSCRAFFRRIVQQNSEAKLKKCKNEGKGRKCEITLATRKSCKRCRFEACKNAGMKTEAVLDESQVILGQFLRIQRSNL